MIAGEQAAVKALIADISHQTRTPIANLLLYCLLYTSLAVSHPVPGQSMAFVLIGKRFAHCKHGNHFFQQFDFHAAFHSQLEVLFELRGGLDDVFRFSHAFRSANLSLIHI